MAKEWTQNRIARLDIGKLSQLRSNAFALGAVAIIDMCDAELAVREVPARRPTNHRHSELRNFESKCAEQLAEFARALAQRFDLSPATAKALSAGSKHFQPHELLGKTGQSKIGGYQRAGLVAIDRYISFRMGEAVFRMAILLAAGQPVEAARWVVTAPRGRVKDWKPIGELIPGLKALSEKPGQEGGAVFEDFVAASSHFEQLLEGSAPRLAQASSVCQGV